MYMYQPNNLAAAEGTAQTPVQILVSPVTLRKQTFRESCSWRRRFISSVLICSTGTPVQALTTASTSHTLTRGTTAWLSGVTPPGLAIFSFSCSSCSLHTCASSKKPPCKTTPLEEPLTKRVQSQKCKASSDCVQFTGGCLHANSPPSEVAAAAAYQMRAKQEHFTA